MRAYVLTDPALAKHAGQFVWLSMDTEKPTGAEFMAQYPMSSWPTLFVVDPFAEKALLEWSGAASVAQLEKLLQDGQAAMAVFARGDQQTERAPAEMAAADRLAANGESKKAALAYADLLASTPLSSPRYGRIAQSYVAALEQSHEPQSCAEKTLELAPRVPGTSSFANIVAMGMSCAEEAPSTASWKARALSELEPLAEKALAIPNLLADDRSGLYEALVQRREETGDQQGAKKLAAQWWDFLAGEAGRAKTAEERAAFDPHRMLAAEKMGDPARAIPLLLASEQDLPDDYNPPARLATVYRSLHRIDEGLAANARALAKVYGPRRLRVYQVQAELLVDKGDLKAAQKTLEDALAAAAAIPPAQRPDRMIAKLRDGLE
jgi:hypothetical protein